MQRNSDANAFTLLAVEFAHDIRRNPAVTLEDWPEPFDDDSEGSEIDGEPQEGPDFDPPFIERAEPPGIDPNDEPEFTDVEFRQLLDAHLGDLADEEWKDIYTCKLVAIIMPSGTHAFICTDNKFLSTKDRTTLRFLATRLRTHFSRSTYDDLRFGVCADLDIPSEFIAWRRLRVLLGLETKTYDMCLNSCCCFLGKYKDLRVCPYCKEPRYNARNKARRVFRYTPLIPQLRGLFQRATTVQRLRYRVQVEQERIPGTIQDVFDGENYLLLRTTPLSPEDPYCPFDNPEDIALGLSTDGVTLFKRRRRGQSTAWPIILINYNLHPKIRTRLENVLCVGVIPGPRQCKDLNSFLIPLIEELLELEQGIRIGGLTPEGREYYFSLRAFVISIFGDIPVIAKLLFIKGHNGFSPCRACYIEGCLCRLAKNSIYYVPLRQPTERGEPQREWDHNALPMRTHDLFLTHYEELDGAPTKAARDSLAKEYGINSRSVFSRLRSIDLASSFPYDVMHLFFENIVPNLILHWIGKFKGLNQGSGDYQLSAHDWDAIGRETARATRTIPAAFVGTLPDIAQDRNLYKAEAYSFWIQHVAPIVLKGRLPERYYK